MPFVSFVLAEPMISDVMCYIIPSDKFARIKSCFVFIVHFSYGAQSLYLGYYSVPLVPNMKYRTIDTWVS